MLKKYVLLNTIFFIGSAYEGLKILFVKFQNLHKQNTRKCDQENWRQIVRCVTCMRRVSSVAQRGYKRIESQPALYVSSHSEPDHDFIVIKYTVETCRWLYRAASAGFYTDRQLNQGECLE